MRIFTPLGRALVRRLMSRRAPDKVIGTDRIYMLRYWVWRTRICSLYVHWFCSSDDDRALHDHPWWSLSVCLTGYMLEHLEGGTKKLIEPGSVVLRSARHAHRLELLSENACTLFLTGPRVREWGFLCPQGWRHWRDFTAGPHGESIGRGCD